MLHFVRSNTLLALANELAASRTSTSFTLNPTTIVVPTPAIARWLQWDIARREGVAFNLRFTYPTSFLWDCVARALPDVTSTSPFEAKVLAWRIFRLLDDGALTAEYDLLTRYWQANNALGRMQLCERIAEIFGRYLIYRPHWLRSWAAQHHAQHWQQALWQALLQDLVLQDNTHPLERFLSALPRLAAAPPSDSLTNPLSTNPLPTPLHLFALPGLAPLYWRAFEHMAEYGDVYVYTLSPTQERIEHSTHPLMLAFGHEDDQAQRDSLSLQERTATQRDVFVFPTPSTRSHSSTLPSSSLHSPTLHLLGQLQHALLTLDDHPAWVHDPGDTSIQLKVCHSLVREIEVLHEGLLQAFATLPNLQPCDVVVMLPNIDAAAGAIHAVFGTAQKIPYVISGHRTDQAGELGRAWLQLLDVAGSRWAVDDVLALVRVPACLRRFGLDETSLDLLHHLLDETKVHWGRDDAHRASLGLPATTEHTWTWAVDRWLLGFIAPNSAEVPYGDIAGVASVEAQRVELIQPLLVLLDGLGRLRGKLVAAHTPADWIAIFLQAFDDFFTPEQEERDAAQWAQDAAVEVRRRIAQSEWKHATVDFSLMRRALEEALAGQPASAVPSGSVTFAELGTLRDLPYRVICLLGLDADAFPRHYVHAEFDLMQAQPIPGDPDPRHSDRAFFLHTIMAASDKLWLSYTGLDIHDNQPRAPSAALSVLLDFLRGTVTPEIQRLHPPAAPSVALPDTSKASGLHASMAVASLDPSKESKLDLGTHDLIEFLTHPLRHFMKRRLKVDPTYRVHLLQNEEPFSLSGREAWAVRDELLRQRQRGSKPEEVRQLLNARGWLPVPGRASFNRLLQEADDLLDKARPFGQTWSTSVDIVLDQHRVRGSLSHVHAEGALVLSASRESPRLRATAWVTALSLAQQRDAEQEVSLISREGLTRFYVTPRDATVFWRSLLQNYQHNLTQPWLCPAKTAWAWLSQATLSEAQKIWHGEPYQVAESTDPWWQLWLGHRDNDLPESFAEHAEHVYRAMHNATLSKKS